VVASLSISGAGAVRRCPSTDLGGHWLRVPRRSGRPQSLLSELGPPPFLVSLEIDISHIGRSRVDHRLPTAGHAAAERAALRCFCAWPLEAEASIHRRYAPASSWGLLGQLPKLHQKRWPSSPLSSHSISGSSSAGWSSGTWVHLAEVITISAAGAIRRPLTQDGSQPAISDYGLSSLAYSALA
jgi:hypothetical protein